MLIIAWENTFMDFAVLMYGKDELFVERAPSRKLEIDSSGPELLNNRKSQNVGSIEPFLLLRRVL
jgi:hypothetical protein